MRRLENERVGCPPELGCIIEGRINRITPRYYCDCCGKEGDIYFFAGEQLCISCIADRLEKVNDEY